jgi:hypothetical protein
MVTKKKKSTKKINTNSILGSFDNKFVEQVKQDYANQILLLQPQKNNKIYNVSIPITYASYYINRVKKTKFYCTSIILDYSLVNYVGIGGLKYITFYSASGFPGSYGYNMQSMQEINFDTTTETKLVQFNFEPPLEFFDNSTATYHTPQIVMSLGDESRNIQAGDYCKLTLLGYETPYS